MKTIRKWLDILVPRFLTEDVAVSVTYCGHCDEPHLQPVCAMTDVEPGERFDGIMTMRCFNLFGRGLFARQVGEIRPWVSPHDSRKL